MTGLVLEVFNFFLTHDGFPLFFDDGDDFSVDVVAGGGSAVVIVVVDEEDDVEGDDDEDCC